jgi:hypothetical protein
MLTQMRVVLFRVAAEGLINVCFVGSQSIPQANRLRDVDFNLRRTRLTDRITTLSRRKANAMRPPKTSSSRSSREQLRLSASWQTRSTR